MVLDSLFTTVIYLLISILIIFTIKVYMGTLALNKKGKLEYLNLQTDFAFEKKKQSTNTQNIVLLEDLNKSLFNRLFKIAEKLLLMQKVIFKKNY